MKTQKWIAEDYKSTLKFTLELQGDEWITASRLVRLNPELKNDANVREIVNLLRCEGVPVISSGRGYKLTQDKQEVLVYSLSLKGRIQEMIKAYKGLVTFIEQDEPINYKTDISNYK